METRPILASRLRSLAGVYAKDWLRYRRLIDAPGNGYLTICNRNESLEPGPGAAGLRCLWQWTSQLHAPTVVPGLGLRLMRRALADHPVRLVDSPQQVHPGRIDVTFVIGHKGAPRLPLLERTLQSIAAQRDAFIECIVVEQDVLPTIQASLPQWVRYIHAPPPRADMPYCRSWAFNVGARQACGSLLVLHDNDMLVPEDYASSLVSRAKEGYEVINLKRFVFYLSQAQTAAYLSGTAAIDASPPESIVQNLEAGGSVAITREGYDRIGGMDESFIGWGGEDNEFWERALTLRAWPYAHLPIVHLWHAAQAGKDASDSPTLRLYRSLSTVPARERIAQLKKTAGGLMPGPMMPVAAPASDLKNPADLIQRGLMDRESS